MIHPFVWASSFRFFKFPPQSKARCVAWRGGAALWVRLPILMGVGTFIGGGQARVPVFESDPLSFQIEDMRRLLLMQLTFARQRSSK